MKRSLLAAFSTAAILTLTACTTSQGSGSGTVPRGGDVRLALTADVSTFDPARNSSGGDYVLNQLMYSPLIGLDEGNIPVPRLAARWALSATGVTLTLRTGLTCSDGSPLTASQAAASLNYYRKNATAAAYAFGPANAADKTTITGDDATGTVSIQLTTPWTELLPALSLPATGIVCKPGLDNPDKLAAGDVPGAGTGPYTLTENDRGSRYTLSLREGFDAYPLYKNLTRGTPPKKYQLTVVKSESTIANQMQTGQIDFGSFTGPDAARLDKGFSTLSVPTVRFYLMFNERPGHPGADPDFRRAVAQAVDAQAFGKVLGGGTLLKTYVDPSAACASDDAGLLVHIDSAAAGKVLAGKTINVVGTRAVADGAGNTYIAEALRTAGATVTLNSAEQATLSSSVLPGGDWDINVMASLSTRLVQGASLLTGAEPPKGRNYGAVHNGGFEAGLNTAVTTVDEGAKCAAWQQAQAALLTAIDIVPLSTLNLRYVYRDGLTLLGPPTQLDLTSLRTTA
ncbi:ABC transporter substrate-binding protein [Nocardia sp. CA-135398]|uniref:ABC transporter substrate-binding protein n=1 Tax=Nocardia sp. CA-135398 TaxID=3239977 RepID=UPI003D96DFF3